MKIPEGRVVGLDIHPDTFAGGILERTDPASAKIIHSSTRVELAELECWALRHTGAQDTLVMEASGNAFAVAGRLQAIGRKVLVLESKMAGKVGKSLLLEQMHLALLCARALGARSCAIKWRAKSPRTQPFSSSPGSPDSVWSASTAMACAIGDIGRFANPKKLVAYFGLNPSVCQSGNWQGEGSLKRHGRGAIRALLVQAAKRLLQVENPLRKWGLALALRRGRNKAAVALARKLAVAAWHVLMGHRIGAIDSEERLQSKIFKLATELGIPAIRSLGFDSKDDFIQKKLYVLKTYP